MRNEAKYSASLRRNGEGKAFFTEFRHPIVVDNTGNQGKKIKKGLGVDEDLAIRIVEELNWLLTNYQIATIELARSKGFNEKTIDCFFGPLSRYEKKSKSQLLSRVKRPKKSDGYLTVAVVGATGSGKTSLIRNLIGTKLSNIAFPAVSSNRTTTATIEYIFDDSPLAEAAVVFASEAQIAQYIKENIIAAIRELLIDDSDVLQIADAFLTHSDMRFKLAYILGHFREPAVVDSRQMNDFNMLKKFVAKIKDLRVEAENYFRNELIEFTTNDERMDFFVDYYFEDESSGIDDLVDEVISIIKDKVSAMQVGEFEKLNGWPLIWFLSDEKDFVLKQMEYFAGNDGKKFGELFAPLVTDIRIKANFKPYRINESEDVNNLVLIDTVGIGHSTKAIDSLDSEIIDIALISDLIIYVDNGSNPINQTANVSIRDLITNGNSQKMIMAYTQLDRIDDLAAIDVEDKKRNIFKVLTSALKGYVDIGVNRNTVESAEKRFREYSLFLSETQNLKQVRENKSLLEEIEKLLSFIDNKNKEIEESIDVFPKYKYGSLFKVVSDTINSFITNFEIKLNVNHWTRVKAMTHRISQLQSDGYDSLKPISNVMSQFSMRLDDFIKLPLAWVDIELNECNPPDKKKIIILDKLVQNVTSTLKKDIIEIMIQQQLSMWDIAFKFRGTGSASKRSKEVEYILKKSLTVPLNGNKADDTFLVTIIEQIVKSELRAMKEEIEKSESET